MYNAALAKSSAAAPSLTEGTENVLSTDLSGRLRVAAGIFARAFQLSYGGRPRLNNRKLAKGGIAFPA